MNEPIAVIQKSFDRNILLKIRFYKNKGEAVFSTTEISVCDQAGNSASIHTGDMLTPEFLRSLANEIDSVKSKI